jgi:hypothetical protein
MLQANRSFALMMERLYRMEMVATRTYFNPLGLTVRYTFTLSIAHIDSDMTFITCIPKDQTALDEAQAKVTAVTNLRNTMLTASNLRGNLLSAYGWDNVATGIIATGAFILVLGVVFFVLFVYEWRRGHLPPTEG